MKKIINILGVILVLIGMTTLYSCQDDTPDYNPSPDAPAGTIGVYFPATNQSVFELMPVDPTEFEITIARTVSSGAVDVPINVEVNEDNVFVVPASVSFADGETEKTFKVTFPSAAEGTTYNLKMNVEGDEFVNPYIKGVPHAVINVTRIKWETIEKPMIYVDGTIMAFFGVTYEPMYVYAEKAELGDAVRYRFKNIYKPPTGDDPDEDGIWDGYPYNTSNFIEGEYITTIEIGGDHGESDEVFMFAGNTGHDWGYGMFSIGSIYGNMKTDPDDKDDFPLGVLKDSIITFPSSSLYMDMVDFGTRVAGDPTTIYMSKEVFIAANLKLEDFNDIDFEDDPVEEGTFKSEAYSDDTWDQVMLKAIDIDEDNKDSEYKNLFYLPNLYEDDFGLAFYYSEEDGISIPQNQPTGIKVFGKPVFMSMSRDFKSEYIIGSEEEINEDLKEGDEDYDADAGTDRYVLGLSFHYEDGTSLGNFKEKLLLSNEDEISPLMFGRKGVNHRFEIQGKVSPKQLKKNAQGAVIF